MRMCPVCGHINAGAAVQSCTRLLGPFGGSGPGWIGGRGRPVAAVSPENFPATAGQMGILVGSCHGFHCVGRSGVLRTGPPPAASPVSNINTDTGLNAWAEVRHDPQNTAFSPEQAPTPKTKLWTYQTSSTLSGAPAAAGGVAYLAANDGTIAALDGRTGEAVWEYRSDLPAGSGIHASGDRRPGHRYDARRSGHSAWTGKPVNLSGRPTSGPTGRR